MSVQAPEPAPSLREKLAAIGVVLVHALRDGTHLPPVGLVKPVAVESPEEEALIARIVAAYQAQKRQHPGGWEGISNRNKSWRDDGWNHSQAGLLDRLEAGDTAAVGAMLRTMFRQPLMTGIAMGADEYSAVFLGAGDPRVYSAQWLDAFVGLAEEVGAVGVPNPEVNPEAFTAALDCDVDSLLSRINDCVGLPLEFPSIGEAFGCRVGNLVLPRITLFHYATAAILRDLWGQQAPGAVLEIGGGFGGLAALIAARACRRYVGIDLPAACAIQAYFLCRARPDLSIRLFGETSSTEPDIELLPSWTLEPTCEYALQERAFDLLVNQDALLEMEPSEAVVLLKALSRVVHGRLLSISPDFSGSANSRGEPTISELADESGYWRRISRAAFLPRAGYWREVYLNSGHIDSGSVV